MEMYAGKGDLPSNRKGEGRDVCDTILQQYYGSPGQKLSDKEIRYAREAYYALITEQDEYVGKIIEELDSGGLGENTVVMYFSDHGEMAGEHGCWQKVSLLEGSVRVPMIIRMAGQAGAGKRVSTPVSLVDLFPTLLEIADVSMPEILSLDGNSLLPLIKGDVAGFKGSSVFGEFEGEGWNHPRAFVRKDNFKYVYNHTADERLYDISSDPGEMVDLSGNSEYTEVKAALKAELLKEWGDPDAIEQQVLQAQTRRKYAPSRNPVY